MRRCQNRVNGSGCIVPPNFLIAYYGKNRDKTLLFFAFEGRMLAADGVIRK